MKIEWIFEKTHLIEDRHLLFQHKMARCFNAIPELIRAAGKAITIGKGIAIGADDLTLIPDIEALIHRIETARAIAISLDSKKFSERGLSKKTKLNVYRVIQEQLGNIAKFSHATEADISLHTADHQIILDIRDNGKPADLSQRKNGVCIIDILACAEMNDGRATLQAQPGIGSLLHVQFPIRTPQTQKQKALTLA